MILKFLYLLILYGKSLCVPLAQDFDAAIWSTAVDNGNTRYDPVFFHQAEISQVNNLADISIENKLHTQVECEDKNHKYNFQYNNIENVDPSIEKEELYVFLDKGRTRYMPLNEHQRTVVKQSPINVNGRDVHLSDIQVLQNVGLNHDGLNDKTHSSYSYFPANEPQLGLQFTPNTHNRAPNYHKKPMKNYDEYPKKYQSNRNTFSNVYDQPKYASFQYQTQPMQRKHQSSRKRDCKRNKFNKNRLNYAQNNKYNLNRNKSKFIKDCESKRRNELQKTKNKAIIHQTDYQVKYTESDVILGSTQNKSDNVQNNIAQDPILGQQHSTAQSGKNFTTIHQGVVKISSPSGMQITTNIAENDFNKSFETLFENNTKHETPTDIQTEPPLLGSTLLTDSPIYYIKITNPKTNKQEPRIKNKPTPTVKASSNEILKDSNSEKSDIFKTNEKSKDLFKNEVKFTESNSRKDVVLGESEFESGAQSESTTTSIAEDEKSTFTTEIATSDTSEKLLAKSTDITSDLAGSEDRLYTYVTKLDKKPRKSKNKKGNKNKWKHMEPIAYEARLMQSPHRPKKRKGQQKKLYTEKPKRLAELHSSDLNELIGKISRRTTLKTTTTTTTMAPQLPTTQSALLFEENDGAESSFSVRRGKTEQQNFFKNSHNDINSSEILGANRFLPYDPCINNEEYLQKFNRWDQAEAQLNDLQDFDSDNSDLFSYDFGESDIHGIQDDCIDSTELNYYGDQFFDVTEDVNPSSQYTYSDFCP